MYEPPYDRFVFIPTLVLELKLHISQILNASIQQNVAMFDFVMVKYANSHLEYEKMSRKSK